MPRHGIVPAVAATAMLALLLLPACGRRDASSPPPPPSAAEPGTVAADDGVPIAYEIRGAGDPVLVFVHGWCCNRTFWRNQLDAFAKDHRVVAIDLPGHGGSGRVREGWSVAGLGADVRAIVDALGLSGVVLVGHSLGGPVALEAARLLPGRVLAVIAVDTLQDVEFEMPPDAVEKMAARFEADFSGTMTQAVRSMFRESSDPAVVEWTLSASLTADHDAAVALMRDYRNVRLKEMLAAANVPVRCINTVPRGDEGLATNVENNRRYADYDAVLVPDAGHFVMLEAPDTFNAKLKGILAALPAR